MKNCCILAGCEESSLYSRDLLTTESGVFVILVLGRPVSVAKKSEDLFKIVRPAVKSIFGKTGRSHLSHCLDTLIPGDTRYLPERQEALDARWTLCSQDLPVQWRIMDSNPWG